MLGRHRGLLGFTIGQREGLGLAASRPLYVIALDQANNRLVVGGREQLFGKTLTAERVNWASIEPPMKPLRARAKIRSRHEPAAAFLIPAEHGKVRVEFDAPQAAITPGQAVVFYDEDLVLGGGWIAPLAHSTPRPADHERRGGRHTAHSNQTSALSNRQNAMA